MCLVTLSNRFNISEASLICYKVVRKMGEELVSLFYDKPYKIGKVYSERNFDKYPQKSLGYIGYEIEHGFHSFSSIDRSLADYRDRSSFWEDLVIIRCEIPEGSKYWVNFNDTEYCSNKIKIVEVLE